MNPLQNVYGKDVTLLQNVYREDATSHQNVYRKDATLHQQHQLVHHHTVCMHVRMDGKALRHSSICQRWVAHQPALPSWSHSDTLTCARQAHTKPPTKGARMARSRPTQGRTQPPTKGARALARSNHAGTINLYDM